MKDDVPVVEFSLQDVEEERVEYRNNMTRWKTLTTRDSMKFAAFVDGADPPARSEELFVFHVFPESYWEPLEIASNNSILVEESTSIALTQYDLQASAFFSLHVNLLFSSAPFVLHVQQFCGTVKFYGFAEFLRPSDL